MLEEEEELMAEVRKSVMHYCICLGNAYIVSLFTSYFIYLVLLKSYTEA